MFGQGFQSGHLAVELAARFLDLLLRLGNLFGQLLALLGDGLATLPLLLDLAFVTAYAAGEIGQFAMCRV